MFKKLLTLEWKQFRRSSNFQQNLFVKIFMILVALYFLASFAILGIAAYFGIKETYPTADPLKIINDYVIMWFTLEIAYRYFMQKLPTVNIKPLMLTPIKKSLIIHFLLFKTSLSIFNWFSLFFFVPFSVVLIIQGYSVIQVIPWLISMLAIEQGINFLIFLINKNNKAFFIFISIFIVLFTIQFFNLYDVISLFGSIFNRLYEHSFLVVFPIGCFLLLYYRNYIIVKNNFYWDDSFKQKVKEVNTYNFGWLDRFGETSLFIKNDLRLIWRNKRAKQTLVMAFLFLLYGLLFFTNDSYSNSSFMLILISMIITGGFMMTFGQSVPAWDSEYYKLLMCQNIPYSKYLRAKWWLMIVSVFITLILALPYMFFGLSFLKILVAVALFNAGVNTYLTILGGVYNKKPIKLNTKAKPFENMQGFNVQSLLLSLPKIFGAFVIYYPFKQFFDEDTGLIAVGIVGIVGLFLMNPILKQIEKIYQEEKYDMIKAFNEN